MAFLYLPNLKILLFWTYCIRTFLVLNFTLAVFIPILFINAIVLHKRFLLDITVCCSVYCSILEVSNHLSSLELCHSRQSSTILFFYRDNIKSFLGLAVKNWTEINAKYINNALQWAFVTTKGFLNSLTTSRGRGTCGMGIMEELA
jgi:hypothetical protein